MLRYSIRGIVLFLACLLMSCTYHQRPNPSTDLAYESWQRQVDVNPSKWARGTDRWFTEAGVSSTEAMDRNAPISAAMSTMMVRVPDNFTRIRTDGKFKVQLFGTDDCNSVYIYGPNAAVRAVVVRVTEDTLSLSQAKDAPNNMGCVIIRIGIKNLNRLIQMGAGSIEGRQLRSNNLCVTSGGKGDVYLAGRVNLTQVAATNSGSVTVFGAITPRLTIRTAGTGAVNVSGNVGIQKIIHHGCGDINIIGANSDGVVIRADGQGKIGINGRVDIREIDARDKVRVWAYYVNGQTLNAYVTDHAQIGLAGCMRNLYVDAGKGGRFYGRYLYTSDAYVRAHDAGHINVTAANKIFAAATQRSSVYFFGSPNILTQFVRENGVIIPILDSKGRSGCGYCPYYKNKLYKD